MNLLDVFFLCFFLVFQVYLGKKFSSRNNTLHAVFNGNGKIPWWIASLSSFMTMFSASTFIIWGGVAFKFGFVAITINLCIACAAFLVGITLAGTWNRLGFESPAEFLLIRYGRNMMRFYTIIISFCRLVGVGVALYSLAVVWKVLFPEGSILGLPRNVVILVLGSVIIIYTMLGGFFAVLATDVFQFTVLYVSLCLVFVFSLFSIDNLMEIFSVLSPQFFQPFRPDVGYGGIFIIGWIAVHYFMIGAEWVFIQRFICVPTPNDARKSMFLFCILYVVSPFLWLIPPMVLRASSGFSIEPEEAYIIACRKFLPFGCLGLICTALFSATASMISSYLNVFSSALIVLFRQAQWVRCSERQYLILNKMITLLLGVTIIVIALGIPFLGGAEAIIIAITSLFCGPLFIPILWGIFSRTADWKSIILVLSTCVVAFPYRFYFDDKRYIDFCIGIVLPIVLLSVTELVNRHNISPNYERMKQFQSKFFPLRTFDREFEKSVLQMIKIGIGGCLVLLAAALIINSYHSIW